MYIKSRKRNIVCRASTSQLKVEEVHCTRWEHITLQERAQWWQGWCQPCSISSTSQADLTSGGEAVAHMHQRAVSINGCLKGLPSLILHHPIRNLFEFSWEAFEVAFSGWPQVQSFENYFYAYFLVLCHGQVMRICSASLLCPNLLPHFFADFAFRMIVKVIKTKMEPSFSGMYLCAFFLMLLYLDRNLLCHPARCFHPAFLKLLFFISISKGPELPSFFTPLLSQRKSSNFLCFEKILIAKETGWCTGQCHGLTLVLWPINIPVFPCFYPQCAWSTFLSEILFDASHAPHGNLTISFL